MIFASIDVDIITHAKLLDACEGGDLSPFGLWTYGMCIAQKHETNGRLARNVILTALGGRRNAVLAKKLVDSGLWSVNEDGSWQIFNYAKKNQSAEEIREKKAKASERVRAWREKRNATGNATGNADVTRNSTRNVQIRTDPEPEPEPEPEPDNRQQDLIRHAAPTAPPTELAAKRSRGTRLPDGWTPSAEAQAWAKAQGVADPCGQILDDFRDYWRALPGARGVKLDWDATYRNRVRQVGTRAGTGARFAARGAEITKQPFDPNAPWMTLPEVG